MKQSKESNISLKEQIYKHKQYINLAFNGVDKVDLRHITVIFLDGIIKDLENTYAFLEQIERRENREEVSKFIRSTEGLQLLLRDTIAELQITSYVMEGSSTLELVARSESMRIIYKNLQTCRMYLKEALRTFSSELQGEQQKP